MKRPIAPAATFVLSAALLTVADTASLATAPSATRFDTPDCSAPISYTSLAGRPPKSDMTGASDIIPHGARLPNGQPMDWALHPRIGRGNTPREGWTRIVPWGQVYAGAEEGHSSNVRIQIRNLTLFIQPKETGRWCRLGRDATPTGGFYPENYSGAPIKGDKRDVPTGGLSFAPIDGRAFHFFSNRRFAIPKGGLNGVYADFEARLISPNPRQLDDRGLAAFVASAGVDYWESDQNQQLGKVVNEDAAIGRFRRITRKWQVFSVDTISNVRITGPD